MKLNREYANSNTHHSGPTSTENKKNNDRKNDTSGQPEQKQERNYSQGENQPVLASAPHFHL